MKKGFTLAELIGVLVVLALIGMIAIPTVTKVIKSNKSNICIIQFNNILEEGKSWASDNIEKLPANADDNPIIVTFNDLVNYGYAEDKLIDPITKEKFSANWGIKISYVLHKLEYQIVNNNTVVDPEEYCR